MTCEADADFASYSPYLRLYIKQMLSGSYKKKTKPKIQCGKVREWAFLWDHPQCWPSILLALSPRAEKEKTNISVVTAEPTDRKLFG